MKRGEIWWADLAEPRGAEPADLGLFTLDKAFLDAPVRRLPARLMRPIDDGLRLALSLE